MEQGFDYLSNEERKYLFGEDEIAMPPDFWAATVQSGAEDRLEHNVDIVDRQTVAGSGPLDLGQVLGLAFLLGAALILVLPQQISQQQLQSHPRCGITTGGKV